MALPEGVRAFLLALTGAFDLLDLLCFGFAFFSREGIFSQWQWRHVVHTVSSDFTTDLRAIRGFILRIKASSNISFIVDCRPVNCNATSASAFILAYPF